MAKHKNNTAEHRILVDNLMPHHLYGCRKNTSSDRCHKSLSFRQRLAKQMNSKQQITLKTKKSPPPGMCAGRRTKHTCIYKTFYTHRFARSPQHTQNEKISAPPPHAVPRLPKFLAVMPSVYSRFMYKYVMTTPMSMYSADIITRMERQRNVNECKHRIPCIGIRPKHWANASTIYSTCVVCVCVCLHVKNVYTFYFLWYTYDPPLLWCVKFTYVQTFQRGCN